MTENIKIDGIRIGKGHKPYIICELSANHNKKFEKAMNLIKAAKLSGANAIKIQTYLPETITIDSSSPDFLIKEGLWSGRSLFDLYSEAYTPWEWHKPMFDYAKKLDITIFSSPFDTTAIDLLEDLNAPAYKIASFEAVDLPLIKYAASTRKPIIISTGLANSNEIEESIEAAREGGCKDLALLHCVSGYPAPIHDYNLHNIKDMSSRFNVPIGLSDHTTNNVTAISSIALGGCIIEKHFTLNKKGGGPDDSFSLEPNEFKQLCEDVNSAWHAMGKIDYGLKASERGNSKFRRSLYVVQDIAKGDILNKENVRSIRPGYGLAPKFLEKVIGKSVKEKIKRGTALSWRHLNS